MLLRFSGLCGSDLFFLPLHMHAAATAFPSVGGKWQRAVNAAALASGEGQVRLGPFHRYERCHPSPEQGHRTRWTTNRSWRRVFGVSLTPFGTLLEQNSKYLCGSIMSAVLSVYLTAAVLNFLFSPLEVLEIIKFGPSEFHPLCQVFRVGGVLALA